MQDKPQDAGHAKKTDEIQEDHEDDGDEEHEIIENEATDSPRPASKADLDEPIASPSVDEVENVEENEVSET